MHCLNLHHRSRLFVTILITLSIIAVSFSGGSNAAPADDYIAAIKVQLPRHQQFESLEILDVQNKSNEQFTVSRGQLKIKVRAAEDLYEMKSYKAGKYVLVQVFSKGDILERQGVGIALPAMAGMGQVKVVLLPDINANAKPLSVYKKGTYEIVSSARKPDISSSEALHQNKAQPPALAAVSDLFKQAQQGASNKVPGQPASTAKNQHPAIQQIVDIFRSQGAVYGTVGGRADQTFALKDIRQNNDGSLSGHIHYPDGGVYEVIVESENSVKLRLKEIKQVVFNGAKRTPGVHEFRSMGNALFGKVVNKSASIPLSPELNSKLHGNFAAKSNPWRNVEEQKNYIQIGRMLWNIETMKKARQNWMAGPLIQFIGVDHRFMRSEVKSDLVQKPYGAYSQDFGTGYAKNAGGSGNPLKFIQGKSWLHHDFKRFVRLEDGDVWTGHVIWKTGTVTNVRNITNMGILNNLSLLSWYKNDVYFRREDGGNKPIIRLNLLSGKLDELGKHTAFATHGSPDGRFLFASGWQTDKGILHVYDAENQEFFTMKSAYNMRHHGGSAKEAPMPFTVSPVAWLNEYTFLDKYGWYDLKNRQALLFSDIPELLHYIPVSPIVKKWYRLPDTDYLDVVAGGKEFATGIDPGRVPEIRLLINRITKKVIKLPKQHLVDLNAKSVTWIDTQRYLYTVSKGALDKIGVWLYDIKNKDSRRLSAIPVMENGARNWSYRQDQYNPYIIPEFHTNSILFIPARNEIAYTARRGAKVDLVVVEIDSGKLRKTEITDKKSSYQLSLISPHAIEVE